MDTILNKRIPFATLTLIGLNLAYFIFLEAVGSTEDTALMIKYGAVYPVLVVQYRQYWRLLAACFMHFGAEHLCSNMLILFLLGDNLERALGRFRYVLLYLLAGIGANAVSVYGELLTGDYAVGAGASGAIFGVIGALLWAVIRSRGRLEELTTRQVLVMLGVAALYGFMEDGVDNTAHLAGAVLGFVLCMILYRPKRH